MLYLSLLVFFAIIIEADASSPSSSAPDNVSSRLMVHIPHALYKEGGYDHREALFGKPAYGGSIAQNVYYAQQDFCDGDVDSTKGVPTRSIDPDTNKMAAWPSPFILMVDRGGCTFVKKVRNAQQAGAAGVVIADNTCLCSEPACMAQTKLTVCEKQEPIMADDGSGADITIPSYLMFKHDADVVKAELVANNVVQIEMSWNLPSPDDRVEYDLWTTPSDIVSRDFLRSFKIVAEALGKHAYFTPHMYIYDGLKAGCSGGGESHCANLCTNNGRYCSTDPDSDFDKGVSGGDVVRESLRRLCIWSTYGATNGIGVEWWDYVTTFNERCAASAHPEYFTDQKCIQDVYKATKIDGKSIEKCMTDSGDTSQDVTNAKLDLELSAQTQRGVVVIPTAFVNTAAIRGALNVNNIFTAICSGFIDGSTPDACMDCAGCPDPITCVNNGVCSATSAKNAKSGGISTSFFMMSMLAVVGFFTALGAWHYKRTREDMREQVRGILAEYMPLEDNEDGRMNGKMGSPMDFAHGGGVTTSLIS